MTYFSPKTPQGYRVMRYLIKAGMVDEVGKRRFHRDPLSALIGTLLDKLEGYIAAKVELTLGKLAQRYRLWDKRRQLELWQQ